MQVKVCARWQKTSPRKIRPIIDVIRGKSANLAVAKLMIISKKTTEPVLHLLRSAIAAASQKNVQSEDLIVGQVFCDEGSKLKRRRYCARGRTSVITKRSSHITIILEDKKPKTKLKNRKTEQQKNENTDKENRKTKKLSNKGGAKNGTKSQSN